MQSPANPLYIGFCLFSSDVISNFLERSDGDLSLLKEVWVAEPSLAVVKLFSKTASWVAKQKDNSRLCADVWLESLHPHCLQTLPCAGVCPEQESSALTATRVSTLAHVKKIPVCFICLHLKISILNKVFSPPNKSPTDMRGNSNNFFKKMFSSGKILSC